VRWNQEVLGLGALREFRRSELDRHQVVGIFSVASLGLGASELGQQFVRLASAAPVVMVLGFFFRLSYREVRVVALARDH